MTKVFRSKPIAAAVLFPVALLSFAGASRVQAADEKINYQDHVLPIFRNSCLSCHNPDKKKSGLDLSTYAGSLAGSDNGAVVAPGDPGGSKLFKLVSHAEEPEMPPKKDKLPDKELDLIRKWIAGGVLESATGKPAVIARAKVDLAVASTSIGKPTGPVAMPKHIPTEPVIRTGRPGALMSLAASPWAPLVAVGGQRQVLLYNSQSLDLLGVLPFAEGNPHVLSFSRNGGVLLAGGGVDGKSGKVVLYDVATGKRVTDLGEEFDSVLAADITPDHSLVALGGPGKLVKGYTVADGKLRFTIKKHTDWITAVAFSPDGNLLATADRAGNLAVWEAKTGRDVVTLTGHKDGVTSVSFRDDSKVLASASTDGMIKLWNVDDGKEIKSWAAHGTYRPPTGAVGAGSFDPAVGAFSVTFTHDGRLVSAGRDKLVKLWKSDGGQIHASEPFEDVALRAVADPDVNRVIGGDWTGRIKVWNVDDGKPVGELTADPPTIAERLETATKQLAERQPAIDKAKADLAASREAAAKADAALKAAKDIAEAAKKAIADTQANADGMNKAVEKAEASLKKSREKAEAKEREATKLAAAVVEAESVVKHPAGDPKPLEEAVATRQKLFAAAEKTLAAAKESADADAYDESAKELVTHAKALVDRRGKGLADARGALDGMLQDNALAEAAEKARAESEKAADASKKAKDAVAKRLEAVDKAKADLKAVVESIPKIKSDAEAAANEVTPRVLASKSAAERVGPAESAVEQAEAKVKHVTVGIARLKADQVNVSLYAARDELSQRQAKLAKLQESSKSASAAAEKLSADAVQLQKEIPEAPSRVAPLRAEREKARAVAAPLRAVADAAAQEIKDREAFMQLARDLSRKLSYGVDRNKEDKALAESLKRANSTFDSLDEGLAPLKKNADEKAATAQQAADVQAAAEKAYIRIRSIESNGADMLRKLKQDAVAAAEDAKKKSAAAEEAVKPLEEAKAKVNQRQADYDKLDREAEQLAGN